MILGQTKWLCLFPVCFPVTAGRSLLFSLLECKVQLLPFVVSGVWPPLSTKLEQNVGIEPLTTELGRLWSFLWTRNVFCCQTLVGLLPWWRESRTVVHRAISSQQITYLNHVDMARIWSILKPLKMRNICCINIKGNTELYRTYEWKYQSHFSSSRFSSGKKCWKMRMLDF